MPDRPDGPGKGVNWQTNATGTPTALKHGMRAAIRGSYDNLPAVVKDRQLEIVGNLATAEGALMELERLAMYHLTVVECGMAELERILADGRNPWAGPKPSPVLARLASYLNGATRALAQLAALRGQVTTIDIASLMSDQRDE